MKAAPAFMLLRPLKPWHLLLLIPYALLSGLAYGLAAHWLVREREPWFTLLMLAGLGLTITLIGWLSGIPWFYAAWVFAGAGTGYAGLRMLFGRGSASEILAVPQVLAVLALFCWPVYERLAAASPGGSLQQNAPRPK